MRNNKGITLVALTISIVVMLILAGVVIGFAIGDNGIAKNTKTAKILTNVQALDDTIKAYTINNDDPYSSSKKTIDDLIDEGILIELQLNGGTPSDPKDDRTLYYVNFENSDINVAELLGLKSDDYENDEKLSNFTYNTLSQLQKLGIYVVDNDLNAAFLKNDRTYGTLVNFGDYEEVRVASNYGQQQLSIYINPKETTKQHEVVLVIDRTVSMASSNSDTNDLQFMPMVFNSNGTVNYEAGYADTRWAATVEALDAFLDTYFGNSTSESTTRRVTLMTFYGSDNSTIQNLGTFKSKEKAKAAYSSIFTQQHYNTIIDKGYAEYRSRGSIRNAAYYLGIPESYIKQIGNYSNRLKFDMRLSKSEYAGNIFSGTSGPTLGSLTCAPNAMHQAYQYLTSRNEDNQISADVIILTDGDSNEYWGPALRRTTEESKRTIGTFAQSIMREEYDGHQSEVYAVGFGSEAKSFADTFGGNVTETYTSETKDQLLEAFKEMAEKINSNLEGYTNTDDSQSITVYNTTTQEIEKFSIKNVTKIVIELEGNDSVNGDKKFLTFQDITDGTTSANTYDLEDIYDPEEGYVYLERAWDYSGLSSSELTQSYNKYINIYTDGL